MKPAGLIARRVRGAFLVRVVTVGLFKSRDVVIASNSI